MLAIPKSPPSSPFRMSHKTLFWQMLPVWQTEVHHFGASRIAMPPLSAPGSPSRWLYPSVASQYQQSAPCHILRPMLDAAAPLNP
jgi:hypothetical protein